MYRIGLLGCGKIGKKLLEHIDARPDMELSFIQVRHPERWGSEVWAVKTADEELLENTDLVIECSNAEALKENFPQIIQNCDICALSLTAFADRKFEETCQSLCRKHKHKIYVPHGAIMGLDGILDGKNLWESVEIESIKHPESIERRDTERTVVFEGSTREICGLFPKNVNVHAAAAMAGIGFDKTVSRLISDPAVNTNSHRIILRAQEMKCVIDVTSIANRGITSAYVPYSACGSLDRILPFMEEICFV